MLNVYCKYSNDRAVNRVLLVPTSFSLLFLFFFLLFYCKQLHRVTRLSLSRDPHLLSSWFFLFFKRFKWFCAPIFSLSFAYFPFLFGNLLNGRIKGRRIIYGRHDLPLQCFDVKTRCTQWLCETGVSFFFFLRIMQHPDASVRGTVIHRSLEPEVKTLRGIIELQPTNKRLRAHRLIQIRLIRFGSFVAHANLYQWLSQFLNSHLKWKTSNA